MIEAFSLSSSLPVSVAGASNRSPFAVTRDALELHQAALSRLRIRWRGPSPLTIEEGDDAVKVIHGALIEKPAIMLSAELNAAIRIF